MKLQTNQDINMNTLTRAEEDVMQIVWRLNGGFLREIVNEFGKAKPHHNTVATILKILVEKEFVGIEVFGRMHRYYPLIEKEQYSKGSVKQLVNKYFDGSFSNIVSSMVKENELSVKDLELLLKQLKKGK